MPATSWLRSLSARVRNFPTGQNRSADRHHRKARKLWVEQLEGRIVPSKAPPVTMVYTESNNPNAGQNAILAYRSDPVTGALTLVNTYPTGGTGLGNPSEGLGTEDSDQNVIADKDQKHLFAVNSGSNTIAVFKIEKDGSLSPVKGSPFPSGGVQPASLGLAGDKLYVVNRGDQDPGQMVGGTRPNYTGFKVEGDGKLKPIKNSTVTVAPGSSPSQALITPDEKFLFGANFLALPFVPPMPLPPFIPLFASVLEGFRIKGDGQLEQTSDTPRPPFADAGAAMLPPYLLGFQAHPKKSIIYAGFVAANELGVYTYDKQGRLTFVGHSHSSGLGICWIAVSPDARYLYASNSTSDTISVFSIADPLHPVEIQNLDLAGPRALLPGAPGTNPTLWDTTPFQLATDPTGKFLFVVSHETAHETNPHGNAIHILKVGSNGLLTELATGPEFLPVPATANPEGVAVLQFDAKDVDKAKKKDDKDDKPDSNLALSPASSIQFLVAAENARLTSLLGLASSASGSATAHASTGTGQDIVATSPSASLPIGVALPLSAPTAGHSLSSGLTDDLTHDALGGQLLPSLA